MGEAKRKRSREATVEDLMAAQSSGHAAVEDLMAAQALNQSDIPNGLNVFATLEAAWQDFEDHWIHIGLPTQHRDALRFAFYVGAQAASNLMMYCEGQDMFGVAADQLQKDVTEFYRNEVAPKVAAAKADEWRTGEI